MANESGKSDDPASGADTEIPEVEAEVVEDSPSRPEEGAFTDSETTSNAAEAGVDLKPAPRMPFTPGVILFLGFAAFSLAVFAFWRLQGPDNAQSKEPPRPAESSTLPQEGDGNKDAAVSVESAAADDQAGNEASAPVVDGTEASNDVEAGAEPASEAVVDTDSDKIQNSGQSSLQSLKGDITPGADQTPGGDIYLPPLGQEKIEPQDKEAFQQATKDAAQLVESTIDAPEVENSVEPSPPPTAEISGFDIDGDGADLAQDNQSNITQAREAPSEDTSTPSGPDNGLAATNDVSRLTEVAAENAKILSEISALKESFAAEKEQLTKALETERETNVSQREEIEAMRSDFQAALDARGEEDNSEINELRERLEKIRNNEIAPIKRRVASAASLKSLERAIERGAPYASELNRFEEAAPGAPQIPILRQYAALGLVPAPVLQERFGVAAREALKAVGKEKAKGFWGAIGAQVQSIITVRPADPQAGSGAAAVISRAEHAVENNDLAAALTELAALSPAGRNAMSSWIADTQARIEAMAAIDGLSTLILGAAPK